VRKKEKTKKPLLKTVTVFCERKSARSPSLSFSSICSVAARYPHSFLLTEWGMKIEKKERKIPVFFSLESLECGHDNTHTHTHTLSLFV
jgi:hypothetical protein